EALAETKPTPEEIEKAREILGKALAEPEGPKPVDVDQARDLGVIGKDKPATEEMTAKDAAEVKVPRDPADAPKAETQGYDWEARFEHFVGKLTQPGEVKQLIRNAAQENENFPAARQGDIPLHHVEAVAEAAGVEPGEVSSRGLGRRLRNDQEVRV